MATIKSYTDISQSKTLSKILPLESADMAYYQWKDDGHLMSPVPFVLDDMEEKEDGMFDYIFCWSLAALLRVLTENKICHYDDRYYCQYMSEGDEFPIYSTAEYDNPVDACVAMIEKLNELKML